MSTTSAVRRTLAPLFGLVALASIALACGPAPSTTPPTTSTPPDPGSPVVIPVGSETVTVSGSTTGTVTAASAPLDSLPEVPNDAATPLGAIAIELRNVPVGSVQRVTVQLSHPVDSVRKLIDGSWQRFVHDGVTGSAISTDGLTITLDLQDGGRGDRDGLANGTILDPIVPLEATQLTVPDQEITIPYGEPFSQQLVAAGAVGDVEWYWNGVGELPAGLTLSPDGVLSGTTTAHFRYVTVLAVDDENWVATKLLWLGAQLPPEEIVPTGAPLPDGVALDIGATGRGCPQPPCGWTNSVLHANGTVVPDERFPAFPNGSGDTVVIAVGGGFSQLDADTGEWIAGVPESAGGITATFSRDRSRMALTRRNTGIAVYDTATWEILRVVPVVADKVVWAPDGSEFATGFSDTAAAIYSATDPAGDRTVPFGGRQCSSVRDWSTTGRLALACETGAGRVAVTLDAQDGSDVRTIPGGPCTGAYCYLASLTMGPIFSPSGSHLGLDRTHWECADPCNPVAPQSKWTSRILVAPDADGASTTPLTEPFVTTPEVVNGFGMLVPWRWS